MDPIQQERRLLRAAYLIALLVPLVGVVVLTLAGYQIGQLDRFGRVAYPAMVVYHAALTVALLSQWLRSNQLGPWLFASLATVTIGRMLSWGLDPTLRTSELTMAASTLTWGGAVFTMAFLAYGTRRGLRVNLALFTVFLLAAGLSLTGVLFTGLPTDQLLFIVVSVTGAYGTMIALLRVLTSRLEYLITARARAALLAEQVMTDPLTGIANRRRLDEELDRFIAEARRYGRPLSVTMIDLDHFKEINDTHGHETGDRVLVAAVHRLRATMREGDFLGRWGGEEFLQVTPQTGLRDACVLADRCRAELADRPLDVGPSTVAPVTASFGVATLQVDDDARSLRHRADEALYTAKGRGRNQTVGFPEAGVANGHAPAHGR